MIVAVVEVETNTSPLASVANALTDPLNVTELAGLLFEPTPLTFKVKLVVTVEPDAT